MLVGMTYDLQQDYLDRGYGKDEVAELDSPVTVEAIRRALASLGHEVELVGGVMPLARALSDDRRWDMVFNFAEGMRGLAREAQVPALLDAWDIPYTFSGPEVLALSLHKGWTNAVLGAHGVPTADFRIVNSVEEVDAIDLPFPLFVKPVAEGSSKGVSDKSLVRDRQALRDICAHVLKTFRQPALVETFLPGREFTVGILGSGHACRVLGVMEVLSTARGDACAYTYANKQEWRERALYELATDDRAAQAAEVARAAWQALGCLDAGRIDVRLDEQGQARFIEVNPLAGLNPESSDLPILCGKIGLGYDELIASIMDSAMARAGKRPGNRS
ncbi:MAG: D-alanine--D-alanine ligase [Desulfomicrobium sp.]